MNVVIRVVGTAAGLLIGIGLAKLTGAAASTTVKAALLMTFAGTTAPLAWVRRHRDARPMMRA